ncbi:acyl carrier protein [Actinokineospora sp.]|uniref:acyl carrier protein n=1 Tax=Actinokineospora sp. TaxID=1872133 RepID=UPI0040379304
MEAVAVSTDRLAEIAELAADLFSVSVEEVVGAESFIEDVEADSLLVIQLLVQLEKRYGVPIPDTELPRLVNLRATYELVAEYAGW